MTYAAFPGWSPTLPQDILLDSGALYIGPIGSGVLLGRTMGGISWDPGRTIKDVDFDGMRAPVKGLQRITEYKSILKSKILQFNATEFTQLEPNFTSASGSGAVSTYYVPSIASAFYPAGGYLADVRAVWRRADNSFFQIRMHIALCYKYTIAAKDKTAAEVDVEFHGLIDPTAINPATGATYTTDDAPYILESLYAGSTL